MSHSSPFSADSSPSSSPTPIAHDAAVHHDTLQPILSSGMTRSSSRALTPSATATQTVTMAPPTTGPSSSSRPTATLHLRGGSSRRTDRHIQWDEAVIDNEHMNKKSSKVCCIYHRDDDGEVDEESECDHHALPPSTATSTSTATSSSSSTSSLSYQHPFPNAYERQSKPPRKKNASS